MTTRPARPVQLYPSQYTVGGGDPRLDLACWSRFLSDPEVRGLLDFAFGEEVDIELSGFKYVNGDGLGCLLTLAQHLGLGRRHRVYIHVPSSGDIADQLDTLGFYELAADGFQVSGPVSHRPRWRVTSPALRASITELSPVSIYAVQADVDRRFVNRDFLAAIDLSPLSEAHDFARDLAEAVQETLRNVLQHSKVRRGFIAFQKVGRFKLQFLISDWGIGIHQSFATGSRNSEGVRVKEALLHRFIFPDRPGLFTVARTVSKWGGSLVVRTGATMVQYNSSRRDVSDATVANEIRGLPTARVGQFPGVQCSVTFAIPGAL